MNAIKIIHLKYVALFNIFTALQPSQHNFRTFQSLQKNPESRVIEPSPALDNSHLARWLCGSVHIHCTGVTSNIPVRGYTSVSYPLIS